MTSADTSGLDELLLSPEDYQTLDAIQRRVLWLCTLMIHHANHIRSSADDLKVGGHQASSASMVSILTALYFQYLDAGDRVSIKPHASPAYHAIQYLLGNLDVIGDAELDEGSIWEAAIDEALQGLGNVLLIVDLNRQSLDRVVPGIRATQLKRLFQAGTFAGRNGYCQWTRVGCISF